MMNYIANLFFPLYEISLDNYKKNLGSAAYKAALKPGQTSLALIYTRGLTLVLHKYFCIGFFDGESNFYVQINKNPKSNCKWSIQQTFSLSVHEKDYLLLEAIKETIGGIGSITKQ